MSFSRFRFPLTVLVAFCLLAALGAPAGAHDETEDFLFTFTGGGWGQPRLILADRGILAVNDSIHRLSSKGKPLWQHKRSAFWQDPVASGQNVYDRDAQGRLVCIDLATGQVRWTSKAGSGFGMPESSEFMENSISAIAPCRSARRSATWSMNAVTCSA